MNIVEIVNTVAQKVEINNLAEGVLVVWDGNIYVTSPVHLRGKLGAVNVSTGGYLTAETKVQVLGQGTVVKLEAGKPQYLKKETR